MSLHSFFPWMAIGMFTTATILWGRLFMLIGNGVTADHEPPKVLEGDHFPCEILWQKWTAGAVEKERATGRPVWLHVSAADWSILLMDHEKRLFSNPDVMRMIVDSGVALLWANYMDRNSDIYAELEKHGKRSIPADLFFPSDPSYPMVVLPEVVTPEIAIDALQEVRNR